MRLRTQRCGGDTDAQGVAKALKVGNPTALLTDAALPVSRLAGGPDREVPDMPATSAEASLPLQRLVSPQHSLSHYASLSSRPFSHLQARSGDLLGQQVCLVDRDNEAEAQGQRARHVDGALPQIWRQDGPQRAAGQRAIKVYSGAGAPCGRAGRVHVLSTGNMQAGTQAQALWCWSPGSTRKARAQEQPRLLAAKAPAQGRLGGHRWLHSPATSTTQSTTERRNFCSWILLPTCRGLERKGRECRATSWKRCTGHRLLGQLLNKQEECGMLSKLPKDG